MRRLLFAAVGCAGATFYAGRAGAALSLNLDLATADTKAELAAGRQADIVFLGDSLSFDEFNSMRPYFTRAMQSHYGDAGVGYVGAALIGTDYGGDWRSGVLGGADPAPHHAVDGFWLSAQPGTTPSAARLHATWNKVELHYIAQPGGGAFDLSLAPNGQAVTRIDTSAATPQVRSFSYTFPGGIPQVFRVAPDGSGPVSLLGINRVYDAPGVRVHRASNGGWGTAHYLRRDFSFDQQLQLLGTDLVMVGVGVNDAYRTREDFVNQLNLLGDRIEAAVPDAEVLLVTPHNYGTPEAPVVAGAIEEVAAARGYGLINLYEAAGSYELFQSNGYLSDDVHFSPSGGEYVGNMLFEAFRTNGASLPEPASLTVVGAAAFLLLGRRRL